TVGNKELNKMEFSYLIVPQPFVELMLHPDKLFDDNVTNIAIIRSEERRVGKEYRYRNEKVNQRIKNNNEFNNYLSAITLEEILNELIQRKTYERFTLFFFFKQKTAYEIET